VSPTPCPTEQQLAALVDGHAAADAHDLLTQHVNQCPRCFDTVATLARLGERPEPTVPGPLRSVVLAPPAPEERRWLRVLPALSAAAALVLAVAWWQGQDVVPVPDTPPIRPAAVRGNESVRGGVAPDLVLEEPADGAIVGTTFRLRWDGPPDATSYEVQVTASDGDVLWRRQVTQRVSDVTVETGSAPSEMLYVWVSALMPDGRRITSNVVGVQTASSD